MIKVSARRVGEYLDVRLSSNGVEIDFGFLDDTDAKILAKQLIYSATDIIDNREITDVIDELAEKL